MKFWLILFVAFFIPGLAGAQIYQWKDENGKTIISDMPPKGMAVQKKSGTSSSSAVAPEQKSLAEQDLEFRKRQKEAREKEEKSQKAEQQAQQQKKYCDSLKNRLQTYQSGQRIALHDDKGERYYLDDAQRAKDIQEMQQDSDSNCQ